MGVSYLVMQFKEQTASWLRQEGVSIPSSLPYGRMPTLREMRTVLDGLDGYNCGVRTSSRLKSVDFEVVDKGGYYAGDVQGVGFRATATAIARRHPAVRGWVRNLGDGRAELFADGPAASIEEFLADVRERMAGHIEAEDAFDRDPNDKLVGFRIVG